MAKRAHSTPKPAVRRSPARPGGGGARRAAGPAAEPLPATAPDWAHNAPLKPNKVRVTAEHFPNGADPDAYALVLEGDCMQPHLYSGDMAIMSPAAPLKSGKIVAIWFKDKNRKPWLKRLICPPMNPIGTVYAAGSDVADAILVEMVNPAKAFAIPVSAITAVHVMVGSYRAEGVEDARMPL